MHITAQHHLSSHSDNRTAKTTLRTQPKSLSPQILPCYFRFLELQLQVFQLTLLVIHFLALLLNLLTAKKGNNYKYHNTIINQISDIHMFVTSSHTSVHAKLQYECKYHNTTINQKFPLISNHSNECKNTSSTTTNQRSNPMCCSKQERQIYLTMFCRST